MTRRTDAGDSVLRTMRPRTKINGASPGLFTFLRTFRQTLAVPSGR